MTYPYSDYSQGAPANLPKGLAVSSLVLGIIGLVLACFLVGGVLGVVALVLGIVALVRVRRGVAGGKGLAIAGIITGALAVLIGLWVGVSLALTWGNISYCFELADPMAQQECVVAELQSQSTP